MLCHDEQRLRLVLANGRRPELGLAPLRRTGTDLAGRLLCADTHGREQNQHQFLHRKSVAASRKPNSVPAFRRVTIIPLAAPSLARSSDRPGDQGRAVLYVSLFGLPPCGVLPATRVATGAVRSYRTFSPLPPARLATREGRYVFCATVLRVAPTGRYPAHCPAEFGLSSYLSTLRRVGRRSSVSLRRFIVHVDLERLFATEPRRRRRRLAS